MATRSEGCLKFCAEQLTKSEKKALRKQRSKIHSLQRSNTELVVSKIPTSHLLVGNGGLMNGINRSQIGGLFKSFGTVERVVMLPQRSYSFVSFKNVEDASRAMQTVNGRRLDPSFEFSKAGVVLYLSYLTNLPDDIVVDRQNLPQGLVLVEDFISDVEEKKLLTTLGWNDGESIESNYNELPVTVEKQLKHRRVKHYGYEFLYGTNTIDVSKPLPEKIPEVCSEILDRIMSRGYIKNKPDQLTVNEYYPGQGIPPHFDTHSAFEDGIVSLSLGAKISMEFRHPDGHHVSVMLPRRSLLVMTQESRYLWTHGITPRKFDIVNEAQNLESSTEDKDDTASGLTQYERETRVSLTFRKIRHDPCNCKYHRQCDSQKDKKQFSASESMYYSLPNTQQDAESLEKSHVHEVYENIADHFSDTRHSPWPKISKFLLELPKGSLVADVGCGNGKYLGINHDIFKTGSDRSSNLAAIAKERGHSVIVCDVLNLPYRSGAFDACICIAVLHHLSTSERRLEGLRELVRIVGPGGLVLIYVWALEQNLEKVKRDNLREVEFDRNTREYLETKKSSPDETITSACEKEDESRVTGDHTKKVKVNKKREVFEQQDLFVPWKFRGRNQGSSEQQQMNGKSTSKSHVFHRFYHVFKEGELLGLCCQLENVIIKDVYYDRGNWCVVLRKV
ncbi:alkylated DNA repair protein alkB homolog 8-like [Actinia tenebrosa]|uniref:tRNA (carboxymethyluridine(34)-5-O)-methyltransferase n=1 Tax=Actinia tenebrosa TaxID=6105 RepID=A0A6P8IA64_ACTTE|nr:alkylated DNA repair protein alkB homolog 8-like [Actinia tenebrosa]